MQIDDLPVPVKDHLNQICGAMNLPDLYSFESVEHLLCEIRIRVSQAKILANQAIKNLGD